MTDEEMVEEYAEEHKEVDWEGYDTNKEELKQAFLAGLKAGRPQWHDLRKDPNDLPEEYCSVLDDEGRQVELRKGYWRFVYGGEWEDDAIVYAWCEIPTFDKE